MSDKPVGDMGFDVDGKPLPYGPKEVRKMIMDALDDPDAHLVAVILRKDNDLMVVMGEPSRATLEDLTHVLKSSIGAYRQILRGQ